MNITDVGLVVSPAFIVGGFIRASTKAVLQRRAEDKAKEAKQKEDDKKALADFNEKQNAMFLKQVAELNSALITRLDAQDVVGQQMLNEAKKTNGRITALETAALSHAESIAFLNGVHSERAQTARAVLEAADLLNRPVNPPATHVVVDSPTLADLKQDKE